jgi:hypothetical protein
VRPKANYVMRHAIGRKKCAVPMPNGMVFRTFECDRVDEKGEYKIKCFVRDWGGWGKTTLLWSAVMMIDCAASGTRPRRAAANATISKATLNVKENGS